jgi:hypothetical protein
VLFLFVVRRVDLCSVLFELDKTSASFREQVGRESLESLSIGEREAPGTAGAGKEYRHLEEEDLRQFIKGDGTDSTAAVAAYLHGRPMIRLADLYLIGETSDSDAEYLTDWESALVWSPLGKFCPTVIERAKVTSQIGLDVATMEITWHPKPGAFGGSVATMNPYQKAVTGKYDNRPFRLWRTVMPDPGGDCDTYGACEWFGGRISQVDVGRLDIMFQVTSFLDVVNQKVPPNVIESSNPIANYAGNTPVLSDSETQVPQFTCVAPSNTNVVLGDCISPSAHKIYGTNKFISGFLVWESGSTLAGEWLPVAANASYAAGGGVHYNEFVLYGSFSFAPTPGDTFYVSTQWPVAQQDATGTQYRGFPYVPEPTSAI